MKQILYQDLFNFMVYFVIEKLPLKTIINAFDPVTILRNLEVTDDEMCNFAFKFLNSSLHISRATIHLIRCILIEKKMVSEISWN